METLTVRANDFDVSDIRYSSPKTLDSGAKMIYVNYTERKSRLILQTPEMILPFDMSCYDKGEYPKYNMEMSFRGYEDNPELAKWLDTLNRLDDKLVTDAVSGKDSDGVKYSFSWFKKSKTSEEVVRALYNPLVRLSKDRETGEPDGKYPPTHRVKLPCKTF